MLEENSKNWITPEGHKGTRNVNTYESWLDQIHQWEASNGLLSNILSIDNNVLTAAIQLNFIIEHDGIYYRRVQVTHDNAMELIEATYRLSPNMR